jgi:hypothetical protein
MNENACQNPAKTTEIPSKAWLCAEKYDQVLLAYLVCVWHIFPPQARRILSSFFNNAVIRTRLAEESNMAGNSFRVISQHTLDSFLYATCANPEAGIAPLKSSARKDATVFFDQAWARFTISQALRRVLFFCQQENELFLYHTLAADFERKPYIKRKSKKTMREMYHASERVREIFHQQLEAVLQQTISDSRLVMEEWQQLHQMLPDLIALDPEIVTQHDLPIEDMKAFWLELLEEPVPDTGKNRREIIHDPQSTVEILQETRGHVLDQRDIRFVPAELSEAMNYACLAAELLKNDNMDTKLSKRLLSRGFFWLSKQQWLDPTTIELAGRAGDKMQHMTLVIDQESS